MCAFTHTQCMYILMLRRIIMESFAALKSTLGLLPTIEDHTNALRAIARLQDTYREKADFTRAYGEEEQNILTGEWL